MGTQNNPATNSATPGDVAATAQNNAAAASKDASAVDSADGPAAAFGLTADEWQEGVVTGISARGTDGLLGAIRTGTWVDPAEAIGTRWLAARTHLKPSTAPMTEQAWRIRVQPRWGARTVGSIRRSEVQEWVAGLDTSASTARRAHSCLAQVLDMAVADGCLSVNPARGHAPAAVERREGVPDDGAGSVVGAALHGGVGDLLGAGDDGDAVVGVGGAVGRFS